MNFINAESLLASRDGVFASPAGASSIAGLIKLIESNIIQHDENVVCIVTMSEGNVTDSIKNCKVLQAYSRLGYYRYQSQGLLHTLEKNKKKTNNSDKDTIVLGNTKRKILLLLLKEQLDYVYSLRKRLIRKYYFTVRYFSTLYQHLKELELASSIKWYSILPLCIPTSALTLVQSMLLSTGIITLHVTVLLLSSF